MTPDTELPRHLRTEARELRFVRLSDIRDSDRRRLVEALTKAADALERALAALEETP